MPRNPFKPSKTKRPFKVSLEELRRYYDDAEIALVLDWMGIRRPPELAEVSLMAPRERNDGQPGPIRLLPGETADGYSLSNAVARLVLVGIEARLPQWAVVTDGDVTFGRQPRPPREASVALLPHFLFEINWADSGPGFSWPEAYHCAWLPGFDRWVVTASQDSDEAHGYTDEAIGHFRGDDTERGAKRVILNWWRWQVSSWGQWRWVSFFSEGMVDQPTAEAWADRVWDRAHGEPLPAQPTRARAR